jgi:Flp pilus assembly protein TadG
MGGRRRASVQGDRGAVALEFALVLPLFVILMFGVVTAGLAYNDKLSIANAVREGARFGSTVDYSGNPAAWANSVQTRVQQVYFNGASSLTTDEICVALEDNAAPPATPTVYASPTSQGTSCGSEPASPDGVPTGDCVVKVWVQKPAHISLVIFPDINFNIGAQSVSYYGRAVGNCDGS